MSEYKKLFKNTLVMTIGNFASKILIFIMLPFYTAVLSTTEYGAADLIFSTTNLLFPIFTCLASEFVLRFTLDDKEDKRKVFSSAIAIHIVGFVILCMFSPIISKIINMDEIWLLFILYYFSNTLCMIISQFVKGLEKIITYSISGVINTILVVGCNLLFLVYFNFGIIGYISAYIIGSIVTIIFLVYRCRLWKYIAILTQSDKKYVKRYLNYSIPMIPNSISWWINNSLDKYILMFFWGVSLTGVYAAGYKIPSFLTIISSIFLSAWQISAIKDFGNEETRRFFSDIYNKYSSIVNMIAIVVILCSKLIAKILLSNDFFEAWKFAPILVYAYVFQTMSGFLGTIYTSAKKTNMMFISTAIGAIINAILNVLLIPKSGCTGAAVATAVSYLFVWLIRLFNTRYTIIKLDILFKRDIMSYIILLITVVLVILNTVSGYLIGLIMLIIMFILNKDIGKTIFKLGLSIVNRTKEKK